MLASNSVYLINDVIDIKYDKLHPLKRFRPLASGKISIKEALVVSFILSVFSLIFAFLLNTRFGWILAIYFVINYAYSIFLKKIFIVDVFCLALFFILRLFAGNVIAEVKLSAWLICMTMILSLILGFTKRNQEFKMPDSNNISGYFYFTKYNSKFSNGIIIGLAVFLFLVYIYFARNIAFLLITFPFAFFGVLRYLYLLQIPGGYGDPVRIAAEDKIMQINLI
jgi:4-hydroxybenzoate polyprenyltransferase